MLKPSYPGQENAPAFKLAQSLEKKYRQTTWDPKDGIGSAFMGGMFVKFREHGSEPSIYLKIDIDPLKVESLEQAQGLLDTIKDALRKFT